VCFNGIKTNAGIEKNAGMLGCWDAGMLGLKRICWNAEIKGIVVMSDG